MEARGADSRGELRKLIESKTGLVLATLMAIAAVSRCWSYAKTEPNNFPDLDDRFRIAQDIDSDGVYRLAIHRTNGETLNWWDDDLVALERSVIDQCGKLSKFTGAPDEQGYRPVNFRLMRANPSMDDCPYIPH